MTPPNTSDDATSIDRRTYLATAGAVAASTAGLSGCLGSGSGTGTLSTRVTDQPGDIADFESCVVTIVGMWLGPAGDADETDASEREYHEYDDPQAADLVGLQGEATQLVDERELEAADYAYLQLDVDGVDATLDDGESAEVDVPGDAPLKFDQPFEIREDETTTFVADFTPVRRGQTGSYVLQPVADGVEVIYGGDADD